MIQFKNIKRIIEFVMSVIFLFLFVFSYLDGNTNNIVFYGIWVLIMELRCGQALEG